MKWVVISLLMSIHIGAFGQDRHAQMDSLAVSETNLGKWLSNGEVDLHLRNFYMATTNRGDLLNYSSMAFGGGMGYYSPSFKGFHVGFSGFFVFQLHEQNIRIADPTTGNVNRYEILLYDMNDLSNTRDLDRLEHFYISYLNKGFQAVFGRQSVNSPFLNEQDNRMRPNTFSGLSLSYKINEGELYGGFFTHVTMRGTVDWYTIENSLGVYPFGRNPLGEQSSYKGNVSSRGIGILGMKKKINTGSYQMWNYYADNLFNTTFGQADWVIDLGNQGLDLGIQSFYQAAIGAGGNENPAFTYMVPGQNTYGIGSKIGWHQGANAISLNYLGISGNGRFLFPREWGREMFYTSMPRERFEGNGGVMAITARYDWKDASSPWSGSLRASTVRNPDILNYGLNKYGVPSYYHFTGEVVHSFTGFLQGMDIRLLAVNKTAKNPENIPDRFRINRVDMWNFNVIMDFKF